MQRCSQTSLSVHTTIRQCLHHQNDLTSCCHLTPSILRVSARFCHVQADIKLALFTALVTDIHCILYGWLDGQHLGLQAANINSRMIGCNFESLSSHHVVVLFHCASQSTSWMLGKSVVFQMSGAKPKQQRHHAQLDYRSLCGLMCPLEVSFQIADKTGFADL